MSESMTLYKKEKDNISYYLTCFKNNLTNALTVVSSKHQEHVC